MSIRSNQSGALNPIVIVLLVVVLGAVGFAGWKVYDSNKDKGSKNASAESQQMSKEAQNAINDECLKQFDDKDFCKFASNWEASKIYKATYDSKAANGETSKVVMEVNGDNSTSVISSNGKETAATVTLNKTSYYKDYDANVWYKIPSTEATTDVPKTETPSDVLDIDTKEETKNTVTYKKIGKEACGSMNCFKYQIIDTADTETAELFVWFDDKDYKLVRMTSKAKDGSISDYKLEYPGSITIKEPSPVQDLPTFDPSSLTQ